MSRPDYAVRYSSPFTMVPIALVEHPEIQPIDVSVFVLLGDYVNRESLECWPSVPTLARRLSVSQDTVRRALRRLESVGAITVHERFRNDGGQSSNCYVLNAQLGADPLAPVGPPPVTDAKGPPSTDARPKNQNQEEPDSPYSPPRGASEDGFADFWSKYPRKTAKQSAVKRWSKLSANERENAIALVEERQAGEWRDRRPEHIPYPATFLNQEDFSDPPAGRRLAGERVRFEDMTFEQQKEHLQDVVDHGGVLIEEAYEQYGLVRR